MRRRGSGPAASSDCREPWPCSWPVFSGARARCCPPRRVDSGPFSTGEITERASTLATDRWALPRPGRDGPIGRAAARRAGSAAALLLSFSGAVALVYETLWVKQLGRVVGVEVHAVTIALSAFFAGLALGSALLGRLADRTERPIRLYAALEAGVAVLGVLATLALARAAAPFVALQETAGPLAWCLPFALVGLPAFLMGGTLPALLRAQRPQGDAVAPATGLLYAANTAGAVAGTLATPFALVPAFGITGTSLVAGTLGLAAAAAALALDRRSSPLPPALASRREALTAPTGRGTLVLLSPSMPRRVAWRSATRSCGRSCSSSSSARGRTRLRSCWGRTSSASPSAASSSRASRVPITSPGASSAFCSPGPGRAQWR